MKLFLLFVVLLFGFSSAGDSHVRKLKPKVAKKIKATKSPTISPVASPVAVSASSTTTEDAPGATSSTKSSKTSKSNSAPPTAAPVSLCDDFVCEDGYSLRSNPDTSGGVADRAACCTRDGVCAGADVGSQCSFGDIESSLIPNPSFEDRNGCPTDYGEMSFADDWVQATEATSDYYVEEPDCDVSWWANEDLLRGASDGVAFVGVKKTTDGTEYIGACLVTAPLQAGTEYTLTMDIAAAVASAGTLGGDTSGSTDLLCIPSCEDFQISGTGYKGDDFELLATAAPVGGLTGGGEWKSLTFVTTPTQDCPAIMFGPAADMTIAAGQGGAYVYYDALNLQEEVPGVCNAAGECVAQS